MVLIPSIHVCLQENPSPTFVNAFLHTPHAQRIKLTAIYMYTIDVIKTCLAALVIHKVSCLYAGTN